VLLRWPGSTVRARGDPEGRSAAVVRTLAEAQSNLAAIRASGL